MCWEGKNRENSEIIRGMMIEGKKPREIAKELSMSRSQIYYYAPSKYYVGER